ncbi:hypothetical protein ACOMHN_031642 [Nucella lapillus]
MDSDRMAGEEDSEEEVDWMDTNWDSVQESSSSKMVESGKETERKSKGDHSSDEGTPLMTRMQLNDHKAGMQGLDKEHINQIIYEVSKGSRFFENERRKEEQMQQRLQEQERKRRTILDSDLQKGLREADSLIAELKQSRDLSQSIVHVDMDAFYAAVEMRDNPSLRNKPMAVGGIGMLSTSNYEARKYGVRAAMPGFIGKKLCPQLVIVPVNFSKYREVSTQVRQVFAEYDPNFCPMSLDEAYLNFTDHVAKRQSVSTADRSFLKRCRTPADTTFCCCDLNSTIRDTVLRKRNMGTVCQSSTDHSESQKHTDINGNSENESSSMSSDSLSQTENHRAKSSTSESSGSRYQVVGEEGSTISVQSADELKTQESSTAKEHAGRQRAAKTQCQSCEKTVPPYEIVTFGVDVESAVHEMRCRIEQRTCLTASAGIAPNMMLSKVCSDQNKPNGQFFLPANCEDVTQFVQKLPIRKVSGIGRVTEQLLGALGISTCSDLFEKRSLLYHLHSPVSFSYFMRVTCGISSTQVARASEEERKSMSTEQTFAELSHPEELHHKCWELCQMLSEDLAKEQLKGKTISLKLKTTDFQVRTRAQTIGSYTSDAEVIFTAAKGILRNEILSESPKPLRLRLMGMRMSKLLAESECPPEKQNTILGFFKKTPMVSSEENPIDLQNQNSSTASLEHSQQFRAPDSVGRLGLKTTGNNVLEGNARSAESIEKPVDCPDGSSDRPPGGEELVYDVSEVSPFPQVSMDENIHPSSKTQVQDTVNMDENINPGSGTQLQDTDRQLEKSGASNYETGPNVSDDENHGSSSDISKDTSRNHYGQKRKENDCSSEMSQTQARNLSISDIQNKSETSICPLSDMPSLSHRHTAAAPHTASTSYAGYDWNDEITVISSDSTPQDTVIPFSASFTQPFTCPVCCKPVGCINLTDFNAHIDKCLQPQSQQPTRSKTSSSTSKAGSNPASQKPKNSQNNVKKHSSGVKSSAEHKKPKHLSGTSSSSAKGSTGSVESSVSHPRMSGTMDDSLPGCSNAESVNTACPGTARYDTQQDTSVCSEAEDLDYMVCPLCGAERSDWTLDVFNQHVDVCLNRNTISQILREQQTTEEVTRKRPATNHQEEQRTSQQGKKAKKNQSPKTERSILSFFKR